MKNSTINSKLSRGTKMCLAILTLLAIAAPGCDNKGYKVVEVSGLVTLDGQPVPGSVVNFQPIADGSDNV
ncbi:MAG: hypothetical protein KDA99_17555, partial [Planctomycetales bacterium]|nr:hypothetical protein [Planctomycetales bacterium]